MKRTPRLYAALPRPSPSRVRASSISNSPAAVSRLYQTTSTSLPQGFFDTPPPPPPPNTRTGPLLTTQRLPIEGRGETHSSNSGNAGGSGALALAPPQPAPSKGHEPQLALLGSARFPHASGVPHIPAAAPTAEAGCGRGRGRGRGRYVLEVGAYGIPKRPHRGQQQRSAYMMATDAPLAVQVGEDAYFVRADAMGVADGVGGWARVKGQHLGAPGPSASALFARRLMHFCADEVDRAYAHTEQQQQEVVAGWEPPPHPRTRGWASPWQHPASAAAPYAAYYGTLPPPPPPAAPSFAYTAPWDQYSEFGAQEDEYDGADPEAALAAHLDALADGIDVLNILERAYERTLGAHVVPAPSTSSPSPLYPPATSPSASASETPTRDGGRGERRDDGAWADMWRQRENGAASPRGKHKAPEPRPRTIPLLAGSSTALVAVLDYVPVGELGGHEGAVPYSACGRAAAEGRSTTRKNLLREGVSQLSPPSSAPDSESGKTRDEATGAQTQTAAEELLHPVLKIAHVGDCMGMLVRGGEVAWRSEEMWWRWNTPVQLSAAATSGSATPGEARTWWEAFSAPPTSSFGGTKGPGARGGARTPTGANTPTALARLFTLPVQAGDVLILASDGLSDNLWDEEVLEEVRRCGGVWAGFPAAAPAAPGEADGGAREGTETEAEADGDALRLRRRTLAGMLSEALCSRARRVATRRAGRERGRGCTASSPSSGSGARGAAASGTDALPGVPEEPVGVQEAKEGKEGKEGDEDEDETPFARRARETGRVYRGGKNDDISVIVAVIAPADSRGDGGVEAARAG
ncbi:hypothetical protein DFH07DRAFT_1026257 [Mycena maculata]|uniref:PPM-type phosphatase domain-containing protein n=1 Tax=Mycena maculata TaxID=230809 RepID=A0AAD7NYH2_9AGAR|nr:hypothetical protein DFH07DRAFT_1026257 [Mycena maculata]